MARAWKGKACWAGPSSLRPQPKLYGRGSRTLPNETDVIPLLDCVHSLHSIQYTRHIQLVSYSLTWTRCPNTSLENKNSRSKEITPLDTAKGNTYVHSWFQTFAVMWMLFSILGNSQASKFYDAGERKNTTCMYVFNICGSVHHALYWWNKSNKMQQLRYLFAVALLYMFRVTISPIIRSTMLYMATGKLAHLGCY